MSATDDAAARAAKEAELRRRLVARLVAQSDPIITHNMKSVLLADGTAAHLIGYLTRIRADDAAEDTAAVANANANAVVVADADAETEADAARERALTVVRLVKDFDSD